MELFSEIYSCYYNSVNRILNQCLEEGLRRDKITEIIEENAFQESSLYIMPKLISGEWNLLEKEGNVFYSKLDSKVKLPVSTLEKAWLKSLLKDKRISLFLDKAERTELEKKLMDTAPLFHVEDFYCYDAFADGDDYDSEKYIEKFRIILKALKGKCLVILSNESSTGKRTTGYFLPIRLEYSSKDDKFRVYAARIRKGRVLNYVTLNLARISKAEITKETFLGEVNLDRHVENMKCNEPVVIEISKERNAVERCMLHFASFEKRTEYDENLDKYICYIYYDKNDETELLIRILSFGPVIRVIGPKHFLLLVRERVEKQVQLMGIDYL